MSNLRPVELYSVACDSCRGTENSGVGQVRVVHCWNLGHRASWQCISVAVVSNSCVNPQACHCCLPRLCCLGWIWPMRSSVVWIQPKRNLAVQSGPKWWGELGTPGIKYVNVWKVVQTVLLKMISENEWCSFLLILNPPLMFTGEIKS